MLELKASFWNRKKCLVTGGAGFIGSSFVEALVSLGAEVRVIDNLSVGSNNLRLIHSLGVEMLEADISNLEKISPFFENVEIVFHLAAMNRAQRSIIDPLAANKTNVTGTLNCLKLSKDNKIKKFVFVSSSSVYKGVENKLLSEDMKLEPLHPYGVGKLAGEHYTRVFSNLYNFDAVILRYFSVYGPRQRGDIENAGVIAKFFRAAIENEELTIFGKGNQKRNFSYVKDVVHGTLLSVETQLERCEVINIASDKEYSILEISEIIARTLNSKSKAVHLPSLDGDPERNPADISKARQLLSYRPMYSFERGIEEIYEHYSRK